MDSRPRCPSTKGLSPRYSSDHSSSLQILLSSQLLGSSTGTPQFQLLLGGPQAASTSSRYLAQMLFKPQLIFSDSLQVQATPSRYFQALETSPTLPHVQILPSPQFIPETRQSPDPCSWPTPSIPTGLMCYWSADTPWHSGPLSYCFGNLDCAQTPSSWWKPTSSGPQLFPGFRCPLDLS